MGRVLLCGRPAAGPLESQQPRAIAPSVCFLASPDSGWITGETLFIDIGRAPLVPDLDYIQSRGTLDEIAKAFLFITSRDSRYITGTELIVDGAATHIRADGRTLTPRMRSVWLRGIVPPTAHATRVLGLHRCLSSGTVQLPQGRALTYRRRYPK